jgi:hypothetical protein
MSKRTSLISSEEALTRNEQNQRNRLLLEPSVPPKRGLAVVYHRKSASHPSVDSAQRWPRTSIVAIDAVRLAIVTDLTGAAANGSVRSNRLR